MWNCIAFKNKHGFLKMRDNSSAGDERIESKGWIVLCRKIWKIIVMDLINKRHACGSKMEVDFFFFKFSSFLEVLISTLFIIRLFWNGHFKYVGCSNSQMYYCVCYSFGHHYYPWSEDIAYTGITDIVVDLCSVFKIWIIHFYSYKW